MYTLLFATIIIILQFISILAVILDGYLMQIANLQGRLNRAVRQNNTLRCTITSQQLSQRRINQTFI